VSCADSGAGSDFDRRSAPPAQYAAPTTDPTPGAQWATRVYGEGPTICWIHGYTMDSRLWDHLWPQLPGYRHVGIDLPGHGRSPAMTAGTTMSDLAEGVAAILRRERADRLVAMSLGTMVAFEVAIRRLHPLSKLAVVAPALVGMPAGAGTAAQYRTLTALRRMGLGGAVTDVWMSEASGIFAGLSRYPERFAALRRVVADHHWGELDFGGPTAFYREPQHSSDLPGSAAQLLVLAGDRDMPAFRDLCERLGTEVAGAEVVTLAGAGHLPLLEQPEVTVPLLRTFLAA
jgi:3-oxoadipate enol-lactonase